MQTEATPRADNVSAVEETPKTRSVEPMGGRWYPFSNWCAAKGFTRQHGYNLVKTGRVRTVMSGRRRYVTEAEDRRFDEACLVAAQSRNDRDCA